MKNTKTEENTLIQISKCRDFDKIFSVLEQNYTDAPVKNFTKKTIKTLASSWCVANPKVCLLLAEVDERTVGFLFGHCLGPQVWRRFAAEHPKHIANLAYAWMLQRIRQVIQGCGWCKYSGPTHTPIELKLTKLDYPFPWESTWGNGGIIEYMMVNPEFRGRGIASRLIKLFSLEMTTMGVPYVEAHIAQHNTPSTRAFIKAGWSTYKTSSGDIWACNPDQHKRNSC